MKKLSIIALACSIPLESLPNNTPQLGIIAIQSLAARSALTTSPLRALLLYLENPQLGKRDFLSNKERRLALQEKYEIEKIVRRHKAIQALLPAALIAERYAHAEDYAFRSLIGLPGAPISLECLARYLIYTGDNPGHDLHEESWYATCLRYHTLDDEYMPPSLITPFAALGRSQTVLARKDFMDKYRRIMLNLVAEHNKKTPSF